MHEIRSHFGSNWKIDRIKRLRICVSLECLLEHVNIIENRSIGHMKSKPLLSIMNIDMHAYNMLSSKKGVACIWIE